MSHEFCKRRCISLPLRLLHTLECFSRVTKRHRGQETMVCVIRCLKWRHCTQLRLIFDFLYPIALFHCALTCPPPKEPSRRTIIPFLNHRVRCTQCLRMLLSVITSQVSLSMGLLVVVLASCCTVSVYLSILDRERSTLSSTHRRVSQRLQCPRVLAPFS